MNAVKLNRGVKALQAVGVIYAVINGYALVSALISIAGMRGGLNAGLPTGIVAPMIPGLVATAMILFGSFFAAKELRSGNAWAWVAAISIFVLTLPSYCLPASVIGLLSLLDREVREPLVAQLDIKL